VPEALEAFDELGSNCLALEFRVRHAPQAAHHLLHRINLGDGQVQSLCKRGHHTLPFVKPQEAVVHKYAV
jgi:hypothetical protein